MDQRNLEFVPEVLIVQTGTSVDFPNSDQVRHQVYSFSEAKNFQLSLYAGRAHEPVVFNRAGLVTLGCNIHDSMVGYIYVTDSPWYGRTGADGTLRLQNLPPGEYTVRIWHQLLDESGPQLSSRLRLADGAAGSVSFHLTRPCGRHCTITERTRNGKITSSMLRRCGAGAFATVAVADEFDLSVDLRAVATDATQSRLTGGLGKLRFDDTQDGLRLGYVDIGYRADPFETLHFSAQAYAYGDHDVNTVDLTELYAEWRPIPASDWRSRVKVGRVLPGHLAREPHAGMALAVHAVVFGDQHLDRRGAAHDWRRVQSRLARAQPWS